MYSLIFQHIYIYIYIYIYNLLFNQTTKWGGEKLGGHEKKGTKVGKTLLICNW